MDVEDSNDLDSNNSSNGEDDSDGDDDFGDPGPFHSTGIDESSLNLHLSDSTIFSNESSDQPQPSTSFGAWRQRKRTDSTNVNDSPSDFRPATLQKAQSKSVHLILSNLCTLLCEHDKTERYISAFPTVLLWLLESQNKFILSLKVQRRHAKFYID